MLNAATTRRLLALHRWCGVLVSANLLVLALTGLVLIFHEEIDGALGVMPRARPGGSALSLSQAVRSAVASRPSTQPVFLFQEPSEHPGVVFVGLSERTRRLADAEAVAVDLREGRVLVELDLDGSFTAWVLKLHAELFAGPVGRLLVGAVGLAFFVSLVSGAVVYGPLMRRFAFGLLRRDKARRTWLADLHKLLGAATLGWTLVVAATGVMLSLGSTLLQYYSVTELAALGAPYAHEPVVSDSSTLDEAVRQAEAHTPGRQWSIVALPGSDLASPRHYTVLLRGGTGLQSRLLGMALVDAREPTRVESHQLPMYLKALLVSEPLHFGDYGGLPLKLLWALFTLATLALSASGLWVFGSARRQRVVRERVAVIDAEEPRSEAA